MLYYAISCLSGYGKKQIQTSFMNLYLITTDMKYTHETLKCIVSTIAVYKYHIQ